MSKEVVWKKFDELTTKELYAILRLRSEVFVVEQACAYLDPDGKDLDAYHAQYLENDELVGYLRLLQPTVNAHFSSLGRIVLNQKYRGSGLGLSLIQSGINFSLDNFEGMVIKIGAQLALQSYYASFGFKACSAPYDDFGIMHIDMELI